jgi:predicted DNA-binding transcriptional regulator AlpA
LKAARRAEQRQPKNAADQPLEQQIMAGAAERDAQAIRKQLEALRAEVKAEFAALRIGLRDFSSPGVALPRYLDVKQCSIYLGRSPKAIYNLVRQRKIPHFRQGGKIQFDTHRLDRWMDRHAHRGAMI